MTKLHQFSKLRLNKLKNQIDISEKNREEKVINPIIIIIIIDITN